MQTASLEEIPASDSPVVPAGLAIAEPVSVRPARAMALGAVCCLIIGVGAPYSTHLLHSSFVDLDYSTPAAVFLLFVLIGLLNPALRALSRRRALAPAEIIVIYTMMIVACALSTMGMASQLVPTIAAASYYGRNQPAWQQHIWPYLKPWLAPDAHASARLFDGLKPGETIPWAAWATPLAAWAVLLLALYTASISLMAIFRRQWVDRERLAYPLTQLPIEIVRTPTMGERPLLRDPVMWMGFATAFGCASARGLHHYWPPLPDFDPVWQIPAFRNTIQLDLRLSFPMIGFFFLANAEAVFSLWLFNRIMWAVQGWMAMTGTTYRAELGPYSAEPIFAQIALGGLIGVAFSVVRGAWPHLKSVAAAAFGRERTDDADEPMSYRSAFWLMTASVLVMAVWLYLSGMPLFAVPVLLIGVFVVFLAMTRIVVESGMAEAQAPSVPAGFTYALLGGRMVGPVGMTAQSLTYVWGGDLRTLVMTSAANGYRMSDLLRGRRRLLTGAMFLALFVTAPAAILSTLYLGYTHGGVSLNEWFFINGPQWPYKWIADRNANPTPPNVEGWALIACGGLFASWLALMRQRFVWWPLHPAGFAIAPTWIMNEQWLNAFIAWLLRGIIVRYGGRRGYLALRPYFLGLILGQFAATGLWVFLDALTGARGNQVFWM